MEVEEDDLEFEVLVRKLSPDTSAVEYVYFDADIPASESMINEYNVDWRERLREDCINATPTESNVSEETQKISDDDDAEEDVIQGANFFWNSRNAWRNKEMSFSKWRESNDAVIYIYVISPFLNPWKA